MIPADSILLLAILIPLFGVGRILRIDERNFSTNIKLVAVWTTAFAFLLSLALLSSAKGKFSFFDFQFSINSISVHMIVVTTLLVLVSVGISYNRINVHLKKFYIPVLILEFLLVMLFSTNDILIFYILFELILITAFILVGVFTEDAICASKFFIILSIGAIFIFLGVIYLIETTGITEIDILSKYTFKHEQEWMIFAMFFTGFACQTALFPLHIWLPDSHTKPPMPVSILLSGILLKIGAFGMITILLPIAKNINLLLCDYIFTFSIITIGYATLSALLQRDMKRIIAHLSIIHMSIITIGIFSCNVDGISGAFLNIISSSLVTTACFLIIDVMENRFGSRSSDISGVSAAIPYISTVALVPILAIAFTPPLPCFVGDFLIISGCLKNHFFMFLTLYLLVTFGMFRGFKIYQNVFSGECNWGRSSLTNNELMCLLPLVILILAIGIYPNMILHPIKDEISKICAWNNGND
ncbi:MAG: NADH-quinone oxidoreductase subunit M [Holosporaceae bacterium]|jgi:NADH-quinone oxidoreductase subunit M|nr:NADH-quinone oxidoreductase subunit M [Holosporaceae bacterium]